MKTARKIFLCIGFIIVAVTCIKIARDSVEYAITTYNHALEVDGRVSGEWGLILFNLSNTKLPFLLAELTLIRNGYVFLTPGATKGRIIRCIISSVLALLVMTGRILTILGCLDFDYHPDSYRIRTNILLTFLPTAIISLALGKKTRAKENDSPTP